MTPRWIAFLARNRGAASYAIVDIVCGGLVLALVLTWFIGG